MKVNEAVRTAKAYVGDLYAEEKVVEIGLEEVSYDESERAWHVTIGFRRPWKKRISKGSEGIAAMFTIPEIEDRWYKSVVVRDSDGQVLALSDREMRAA